MSGREFMFKLALVAFGITTAWAMPATAAGFPEKNIDFIIPFGPGGGFDRTVRIISPALEKTLPNKVEVVPKNVPGAGGAKGLATVFRAKPDGHTLAIANMPGAAIPAITNEPVEYDVNKFTWIARLATEEYMLAVSAKSAPSKTCRSSAGRLKSPAPILAPRPMLLPKFLGRC
jgi:tripartite-type tricarboxylate transporter receptor subunit TctC